MGVGGAADAARRAVGPARATRRRDLAGVVVRGAGFLLLALPFLPLPLLFGEIPGASALVPPGEWLLGLGIFGTAAWLLGTLLPAPVDGAGSRLAAALLRPSAARFGAALLAALGGLLLLTSLVAFRRHPLLVDSVVQLFQARIFAEGRLTATLPPLQAFFVTQQVLMDAGGWYAQYPPGHSALLALGLLGGAAWAVPVALTTGTALLLFRFAGRAYGPTVARVTLALAVLCPFFWFMGASFMNHVSALFFVALFLYAFLLWEQTGRGRWAFVAGAALGAAALSRPLDAVAVGLPFGLAALLQVMRSGRHSALAAGLAGFLPPAALYFAFNAATTGDPLLPGYVKLWGESHGLGFHETPWGDLHTPWTGLPNELTDLALLNVFLFEWPVPALLPLGLALAAGWLATSWDRRLVAGFLALPAVYLFYWHRDAFLGPRFLYSGLAFLLPLSARAICVAFERARSRVTRPGPALGSVGAARVLLLLLILCFAYSVAVGIPQRFRIYETGRRSMKVDLVARARAAGLEGGLLLVAESWGSRLLARLRGLQVPASLAEKAYRRTDHCELELLVRRAEAGGMAGADVASGLRQLMARTRALEWRSLNGDPTLRLRPGLPPAAECVEELLYDRAGYSLFTPHLPENEPDLNGRFVIARDLRGLNAQLRALFPHRPAYLWRGGAFIPLD
ncbi:MAG: glycosyltransferase family 39 protein [Gemmatimonadota bacterium]